MIYYMYIVEVIGVRQKSTCVLIIDNNHNCVYKHYIYYVCVCVRACVCECVVT